MPDPLVDALLGAGAPPASPAGAPETSTATAVADPPSPGAGAPGSPEFEALKTAFAATQGQMQQMAAQQIQAKLAALPPAERDKEILRLGAEVLSREKAQVEELSRVVATRMVAQQEGIDADWLAEHTRGATPDVLVKVAKEKARLERALTEARAQAAPPAAATGRPDSGGGVGGSTTKAEVYKQFVEQGKGDIAGYLDTLDRLGLS